MKNKEISIGDRVKVLWNFDNKYYTGKVIDTSGGVITISAPSKKALVPDHRISLTDKTRIKKLSNRKVNM